MTHVSTACARAKLPASYLKAWQKASRHIAANAKDQDSAKGWKLPMIVQV
jgi:hypothetical protein